MIICGIYGIFNIESSKILVGSSMDIENRWSNYRSTLRHNKHCNIYLQDDWNDYGESVFEFRVLEECSVEMLLVREDAWMDYYKSLERIFGYNIQRANRPVMSEETKKKISISLIGNKHSLGRKLSDEHKATLSRVNKGRKHSDETKEKIRQSKFKLSPESRKRLSLSLIGKHPSVEARQRMSLAKKGKHLSDEHKKNLSLANMGKIKSSETCAKISISKLGTKNPMYGERQEKAVTV